MADQSIFANLISTRASAGDDFDVLTFVHFDNGSELVEQVRSYQDLQHNGQRLASALLEAGMGKGDSFALVMQNHPEFVDTMVASSICGTVFVPVDPRTRGEKLAYMLGFAECRGAIVADYALEAVLDVLPQTPTLEWLWVIGTAGEADLPASPLPIQWLSYLPPPPEELDDALFLFIVAFTVLFDEV